MDEEKAHNVREERQHTKMHVVGNDRAQRQHTVRLDGGHELQGSVGGRRLADVSNPFIQLICIVAERTKVWNARNIARAKTEGGH